MRFESMDSILVIARAVAHPTRLFLLQTVGADGCSLSEAARRAAISASNCHHHLSRLVRAGLLIKTKRGRERVYRWGPDRLTFAWERVGDGDAQSPSPPPS
jgi:DNA-binding transcriptional ArsR family regulator